MNGWPWVQLEIEQRACQTNQISSINLLRENRSDIDRFHSESTDSRRVSFFKFLFSFREKLKQAGSVVIVHRFIRLIQ